MKKFWQKYAEWILIAIVALALLFVYYVLPALRTPVRLAEARCSMVTYYAFGNAVTITDPECK